jgi:hypothetical protein
MILYGVIIHETTNLSSWHNFAIQRLVVLGKSNVVFIHSFIHLHSMDPYMAGRPVDIEIVKTTGQIPSII